MLRSIGYRGRPLDSIPFDERRGLIRNEGGRVTDETGAPHRGEYVVGWIKRGPSGVIGTNKKDAADTVAKDRWRIATPARWQSRRTPTPTRSPAGSPSGRRTRSRGRAGRRSTRPSAARARPRAARA